MSQQTPQTEDTDKAVPQSVSFYPGSLYTWARDYGASLVPKRSASAVVCLAVKEFKKRNDKSDQKETQILAAARSVGLDDSLAALSRLKAARSRRAPAAL